MPKTWKHQNVHECNELVNGSVNIIKYTDLKMYKLQQLNNIDESVILDF